MQCATTTRWIRQCRRLSCIAWSHHTSFHTTSSRHEDHNAADSEEHGHARPGRATLHKLTPYVDVNSLANTLELHEEGNSRSRISRIADSTNPDIKRPSFLAGDLKTGPPLKEPLHIDEPKVRRPDVSNVSRRLLRNLDLDVDKDQPTDNDTGYSRESSFREGEHVHETQENSDEPVENDSESPAGHDTVQVRKVGHNPATANRRNAGLGSQSGKNTGQSARRRVPGHAYKPPLKRLRDPGEIDWRTSKIISQRRRFLLDNGADEASVPYETTWEGRAEVLRKIRNRLRNHWNDLDLFQLNWDVFEYKPWAVPTPTIRTTQREPWLSTISTDDSLVHLDSEIEGFVKWIRPTDEESRARGNACNTTIELLKRQCPELDCTAFGSQTTGLELPDSDIDIRLFDPNAVQNLKRGSTEYLAAIRKISRGLDAIVATLSEHGEYTHINPTQNTTHPLVQVTHVPSGLTIQIVASPNTSAAQAFVERSIKTYPQLKPVYLVLKTGFHQRNLLTPYTGGISSYALFNLIHGVLRARSTMLDALHEPAEAAATINPSYFFPSLYPQFSTAPYASSPGLQLLDVLHFVTNLQTYTHGLTAATGQLFPKTSPLHRSPQPVPASAATSKKGDSAKADPFAAARARIARVVPFQSYLLCLQDGADPDNDLGRKASGWKNLQATAAQIYGRLCAKVGVGEAPPLRLPPEEQMRRWKEGAPRPRGEEAERWVPVRRPPGLGGDPRRAARIPIPILREVVGRVDVGMEEFRTRMELFGNVLRREPAITRMVQREEGGGSEAARGGDDGKA